jgi:hypothetical protein
MFLTIISTGQFKNIDYHFEGKISEEVLRNYLSKAITMAEVCTPPAYKLDGKDNCREDDIRLIKNLGAKFIGRAIYRWGNEQNLNAGEFFAFGKKLMEVVHISDPEVVFQACIFEAVTPNVEEIIIPDHVFKAYGLLNQSRSFDYDSMLFLNGRYKNHFGKASVPDITRLETKMWFYYLATKYVDEGYEAIHWGQVALTGYNDKDWTHWFDMLGRIREYAKIHARRHFILNDAHTPEGGFLKDETHLLDFNSFPLRLWEKIDKPMAVVLPDKVHFNSIYNRSKGGMTASGWSCKNLPYLVEFDNFGISNNPGKANRKDHFVWGYDEISWLSVQSVEDQRYYLKEIFYALKQKDPNAYLQMPVGRGVNDGKNPVHKYKANMKSDECSCGTGLEETIQELFILTGNL